MILHRTDVCIPNYDVVSTHLKDSGRMFHRKESRQNHRECSSFRFEFQAVPAGMSKCRIHNGLPFTFVVRDNPPTAGQTFGVRFLKSAILKEVIPLIDGRVQLW